MKQNRWKKILFALGVFLVLVVSFWYGGNSEGLRGFSISMEQEKTDSQLQKTYESGSETTPKEDSSVEVEQSDKKENVFQQIIMHITKKKSASDTSQKTQNSKKAQKNASKAAKKSNSKKKKVSATSDGKKSKSSQSEQSDSPTDQTTQNANQNNNNGDTAQNNQPEADKNHNNQTNNTTSDTTDSETITCTIYISCATLLDHMDRLSSAKKKMVPADGVILKTTTVKVKKGSNVFDVLKKTTKENKIHLEYSFTPIYKSYYIEGIHNLYEFDGGELAGWMYHVNREFPGYGCSEYEVKDGDEIKWLYTCNLGKDVGSYFEK